MSRRRLVAILLGLALAGCSSGSAAPEDAPQNNPPANPAPNPSPPSSGTVTAQPTIPANAATPVGVTWHIGITENVSLAQMQMLYASFVAANNTIWQISEGQTRVDTLKFFDSVAPGMTAQQFTFGGGGLDTRNLDVLVFPRQTWNIQASGAVSSQPGMGRNNRLMILPENARTFVITHEAGHFLFQLSWAVGPLLVDEYQDGVQDVACVMESENLPLRWCSAVNHRNQSSQPHACWAQILTDYPRFSHSGSDKAPGTPAAPKAEYNDTP